MITEENIQVNPLNYLRIFFRRKWFFILPIIIGLAVAFSVANFLPKIYESRTVILIEEEKFYNPLVSGLAVSRSAQERLGHLRDQILSWNRLVKLTEKLNLAKDIKDQEEFESFIVKGLRKNISVKMHGHNLAAIAFQGSDPEKAQLIVKTITDMFIQDNITFQNRESDVAIAFLEDQLKIYHRKIKESQIAGMQERLRVLLIDSTEAHPMVKDLKKRIARAGEEMIKNKDIIMENPEFIKHPAYQKLQRDLEKEISTIETEAVPSVKDAQSANEGLYKVALMSSISDVLARDLSVNEKTYNTLLEKLETAKISKRLEASKEGTRYTILDPARVPHRPIKPNKVLVTIMGAFLGGVLGLALIVSLEILDKSFLGVDEAKAFLDLPILGAISKIMTDEDIAKEKAKRTMRLGISISASIAFICVVIIYTIINKP